MNLRKKFQQLLISYIVSDPVPVGFSLPRTVQSATLKKSAISVHHNSSLVAEDSTTDLSGEVNTPFAVTTSEGTTLPPNGKLIFFSLKSAIPDVKHDIYGTMSTQW